MSLLEILKNVYSFIKVLQSCSSADVADWDDSSIANALSWAKYCEQLFTQSQGKSYESELDEKIQQLAGHSCAVFGNSVVCLNFLKEAQKFVYQVLAQNPKLRQESFQCLVDQFVFSSSSNNKSKLYQYTFEIAEPKCNVRLSNIVQQIAVGRDKDLSSELELLAIACKTQACLLLQHVSQILASSTNNVRTEHYLHQTYQKFSSNAEGLEILIQSLVLEDLREISNSATCQDSILVWLLSELEDSTNPINRNVWLVNKSLLTLLAGKHFRFFKYYMKHLIAVGAELCSPSVSDRKSQRTKPGSVGDYKSVLSHFEKMWRGEKHIRSALEITLRNLAEQDRSSVWVNVLEDLMA